MTKQAEQRWNKAYQLVTKFSTVEYAKIGRESWVMPGIPIGTPIKILRVDPPVESYRNMNMPYVNVHIQLPNSETRNINAEALDYADRLDLAFDHFALIYKRYNLV